MGQEIERARFVIHVKDSDENYVDPYEKALEAIDYLADDLLSDNPLSNSSLRNRLKEILVGVYYGNKTEINLCSMPIPMTREIIEKIITIFADLIYEYSKERVQYPETNYPNIKITALDINNDRIYDQLFRKLPRNLTELPDLEEIHAVGIEWKDNYDPEADLKEQYKSSPNKKPILYLRYPNRIYLFPPRSEVTHVKLTRGEPQAALPPGTPDTLKALPSSSQSNKNNSPRF